jgi:hypothetical protein
MSGATPDTRGLRGSAGFIQSNGNRNSGSNGGECPLIPGFDPNESGGNPANPRTDLETTGSKLASFSDSDSESTETAAPRKPGRRVTVTIMQKTQLAGRGRVVRGGGKCDARTASPKW